MGFELVAAFKDVQGVLMSDITTVHCLEQFNSYELTLGWGCLYGQVEHSSKHSCIDKADDDWHKKRPTVWWAVMVG